MRRWLLCVCGLALIASPAMAKDPVEDPGTSERIACTDLVYVCWEWDGSYTTELCEPPGAAVWQYGADGGVPQTNCYGDPVGDVLGTVLNANYINDAGHRAIVSGLTITDNCYLLEMCHWYDIEYSYDGGNLKVNDGSGWTVVSPMGGYPDDLISDSTYYYAWCMDMQPGFTGSSNTWVLDCFDLTAYIGSTVDIALDFGSDSSVTYWGWYVDTLTLGGPQGGTPVEQSSWSKIKSMY